MSHSEKIYTLANITEHAPLTDPGIYYSHSCDYWTSKKECLHHGFCGWCIGYKNQTDNLMCINQGDWCDDQTYCQSFHFPVNSSCYSLEVDGNVLLISTSITVVCLLPCCRCMSLDSHSCDDEEAIFWVVYAISASVYLLFVIICIVNGVELIWLNIFFAPFLFCIAGITVTSSLQLVYWGCNIALTPFPKAFLWILIVAMIVFLVSLFGLAVVQSLSSVSVLGGIVFLSIVILGADLIQLAFEAQTKQTKVWIKSKIKNENNSQVNPYEPLQEVEEEEKETADIWNENDVRLASKSFKLMRLANDEQKEPPQEVEEEEQEDMLHNPLLSPIAIPMTSSKQKMSVSNKNQHKQLSKYESLLIGELLLFMGWVATFVAFAIIDEEKEACYMNLASLGAAIVNVIVWIIHNRNGSCFKGCIVFLVVFCVSLIVILVYSCEFCHGVKQCTNAHISFIVLVFIWGLIVGIQSCLK